MAGLWSVKFDHKNGEDRVCRKCNTTFHANKPIWICRLCQNEEQRKIQEKKRELKGKKENYPFSTKTNEAGKRFSRIAAKLNKVWKTGDRELIRQFYVDQLKEAEELGIIDWINDIRTNKEKKQKKVKSKNQISKDLPDTRYFNGYED